MASMQTIVDVIDLSFEDAFIVLLLEDDEGSQSQMHLSVREYSLVVNFIDDKYSAVTK